MPSETADILPPFLPGIFTPPPYDQAPPRLLGGFCRDCQKYTFPRPRFCPRCLGLVEEADLGREGTLYSFTVIRTKPPLGLPQPYCVGYIDLKGKALRVFGLLDAKAADQLRVGLPVRLAVAPLGLDGRGRPCLRPYFAIQEDKY
jgi:uncharacterized protein